MMLAFPGAASTRLPTRMDFGGAGFLRSLFACNQLAFFDDEIMSDIHNGRDSKIPVGHSVTLDLNAVNYITALVRQKEIPLLKPMVQAMQHITRGKFNYDASLYFWENAADEMTEQKKAKMRENLIAWEVFKSIDTEWFLATGECRATLSDQAIAAQAEAAMSGYLQFLNSNHTDYALHMHRPVYAILLKLAIIELTMKRDQLTKKTEALLGFMHDELGSLFLRELVFGCSLFLYGPSQLLFFRKLQANQSAILKVLKNMAWDIVAMHRMERYPDDLPEGGRRYFLTYLLTFDRGLVELLDLYPLKALLYLDGTRRPVGFAAFDVSLYLTNQCGVSERTLIHYFSLNSKHTRDLTRRKRGDLNVLIAKLEAETSRLID